VKTVAKSTKGFEAGWVNDDVAVGLLVFAVFVFVSFFSRGSVGVNGGDAHGVGVAARDVNKVMRYVFAAEGNYVEAEVWFAWD
jgi:hypothetical protein